MDMHGNISINRFPVELLVTIFSFCRIVDQSPRPRVRSERTAKPRAAILTISQVCRLWRAIALENSSLWVDVRGLNPDGYQDYYLQRSHHAPISILFDNYDRLGARRTSNYHVHRLLPSLRRARKLSFMSDESFWAVESMLQDIDAVRSPRTEMPETDLYMRPSALDNLRELYVHGENRQNMAAHLIRFSQHTRLLHASLTELSLIDVVFATSGTPHTENARSISCLLECLALLPTLIHLSLEARKPMTRAIPADVDDTVNRPAVSLLALRTLRILDLDISIMSLVNALTLPRGVALDLTLLPAHTRTSIPGERRGFVWSVDPKTVHAFLKSILLHQCMTTDNPSTRFAHLTVEPPGKATACQYPASHLMYHVALSDPVAETLPSCVVVEVLLPDIQHNQPSSPMLSFLPPLDAVRHFTGRWALTQSDWLALASSMPAIRRLTVTNDALQGLRDAVGHRGTSLFPLLHEIDFVFVGDRDRHILQHRWIETCTAVAECLAVLGNVRWDAWTEKCREEWSTEHLKAEIREILN